MALTKVSSSLVSDSAVTSGKIADGGVATADIATNAVTSTKIAQNSILTKHIDDGQVTTDQLGADAVTAAKIADDAISEEHLDVTVITSLTAVTAATGDLLMVADVSDSNNLKKIPVSSILAGTHTGAVNTSGTINSGALGVTGNIAVSGTVDGIDIAARDAVLTSTTTTAGAALPKAGGTLTGDTSITKSGNPVFMVKTTGAGNNPVLRLQADTNKWDLQGTFSNTNDELFFMYNSSTKMSIDKNGQTFFFGEVNINTGDNKKLSFADADDTFRAGIQVATNGGQMVGTSAANDFAFRSQSNMLFSSGGNTERMRISAAGKVIIGGNYTADSLLHLESSTHTAITIQAGTNSSASLRLKNDAQDWDVNCQTNDTFAIYNQTNSTQPFSILPSGNVGIGTTSPDDMLDVENGNIRLRSNSDGSTGLLRMFDAAGTEAGQIYPAAGDIKIYSPNDILFTNSGKVGLGTNTPGVTLDILTSTANTNGVVRIQNNMDNNYEALRIHSLGNFDAQISFLAQGSSTYWGAIGIDYSDAGKFKLQTDNLFVGGSNLMTWARDGKIGIGTTSPSEMLHIVGGGSGPEVRLQNASSSHYIRAYNDNWNFLANSSKTAMTIKNSGDILYPNQTFFSVKRSGNQTFANAAWVDVIFNSEITDTGANFASNAFTVPVAGVYLFTGLIAFTTVAATNYLLARIVCSSTGDFYITHEQKRSGGGDYGYDSAISDMITLSAGETVKIQVFAGSGGDHVLRSDTRWQGRLMG